MTGSESCVQWRIASPKHSSSQKSGERGARLSPSWHNATFRPVPEIPSRTSISPPPVRRRSSARLNRAGVDGKKRHRDPPTPKSAPKEPCSVRCACCCLSHICTAPRPRCCQCYSCCKRRRKLQAEQAAGTPESRPPENPPQQVEPPSPQSPDTPPQESDSQEEEEVQAPPAPPVKPQPQPSVQCCPCLHFLGGSPYYPAPEPDTWQFVYWPPVIRRSSRKPLPLRPPRKSRTGDDAARRQVQSARIPEPTKGTSETINRSPPKSAPPPPPPPPPLPPKDHRQQISYTEEDIAYCKGGWRCRCSKYELPESCILAPLPPTTAPYVETTLLVPTSTRVIVPATPGLSSRAFRVCMPPSELPMCHCPPECPCPHPRCPIDNQPYVPCAGLIHPRATNEQYDLQEIERPKVLFGRDPLLSHM